MPRLDCQKQGLCHLCSAVSGSFATSWTMPTRLLCPWNFPGRNTEVGGHNIFVVVVVVVVVVHSLSCFWLFVTPWTAAHQASLSFTISRSLFKLMFIESVMPSNHLTLCHPHLLPSSILASIRVFSNELAFHIRYKQTRYSIKIRITASKLSIH